MTGRVITFWLGLGSRYSYLAGTQLSAFEARTGARFDWQPVNSVRLIQRANEGASPFDVPSPRGQYDLAWRDQDARRWADYYGVPYRTPDLRELDLDAGAVACWSASEAEGRAAIARALHKLIFVAGQRPDKTAIAKILQAQGIEPGGEPARRRHEAAMDKEMAAGVFGVPSFEIDDKLFWGNDRLILLENYLQTGSGA